MSEIALSAVLRRDRLYTSLALAVIVVLAWAYVISFAGGMPEMPAASGMGMEMSGMDDMGPMSAAAPQIATWSSAEFGLLASMWIAMMIGMMTPSAAPMILLYARVGRSAATQGKPFASPAWFAGGYLLAWSAFAVLATAAQWLLEQAALLTPAMSATSQMLGGIILIVAGLYQWTPLKHACLATCQAPLNFIQQHGGFQRHAAGAIRLGLQHGLYCIGCCWALMSLLFVGGVMNPLWIAAIAALVLIEKLTPGAWWIPRTAGIALAAAGLWMVVAS